MNKVPTPLCLHQRLQLSSRPSASCKVATDRLHKSDHAAIKQIINNEIIHDDGGEGKVGIKYINAGQILPAKISTPLSKASNLTKPAVSLPKSKKMTRNFRQNGR